MKQETELEPLGGRAMQVLAIVVKWRSDKGYSPSMRDISDELGGISTNAVFRAVDELTRKGYVRRVTGMARGIVPVPH